MHCLRNTYDKNCVQAVLNVYKPEHVLLGMMATNIVWLGNNRNDFQLIGPYSNPENQSIIAYWMKHFWSQPKHVNNKGMSGFVQISTKVYMSDKNF